MKVKNYNLKFTMNLHLPVFALFPKNRSLSTRHRFVSCRNARVLACLKMHFNLTKSVVKDISSAFM